ncbi:MULTISPECIES: hypothetical protein [Frankia]|uniref:Uncharacterized protein n=1 Tax=Frankia alni (strain DSM 45986 / CECT 9034 / ACN14a) TaxID=326424 RepID=Q0RPD7_FRAAA|nr:MULTISPECIES: hypothetical protein [Frankia]CAJ60595.1 hypothetical protein; putative signal peptide [Frankia alni ACN14a]
MESEFEWGRILLAVALLTVMFLLPALVIWRDQVRDRRRFGASALCRPVRYGPDGAAYREGVAPAVNLAGRRERNGREERNGRDGRNDSGAFLTMAGTPGR